MDQQENLVYKKEVLDFVKISQEYISLIELSDAIGLKDFIDKTHILLPQLYAGMVSLPEFQPDYEDLNQRFVTEEDYDLLHKNLLLKFGEYDNYNEVFNAESAELGEASPESISENLCDIYQDIKDFILLFEVGTNEIMYEALWELQQSFENFWGQKLTNTLRALHQLRYSAEEIVENVEKPKENDNFNVDTSNWFITRRQGDMSDD